MYINGIGNISPQATFHQPIDTTLATPEGAFFQCQEPKYKKFIKSRLLRRMSRIVRMGLTTAQVAMDEAQDAKIDAMMTGTAWGCVKDTEKFLATIIENDEQYLTPTAFVQSTHNTVGGQIALMHKNNCYNMSYVHGYFSFESALLDALMQNTEGQIDTALVGGIDEQTEDLHILLERLNCASPQQPMGEGSAFFVLSNQPQTNSYAQVMDIQMCFNPSSPQQVKDTLQRCLQNANLTVNDLDLVLTGTPKDNDLFGDSLQKPYKQLCGEYPTSTAFAMALGANILKGEPNSKQVLDLADTPDHLLIYNNHQDTYYSFILLAK